MGLYMCVCIVVDTHARTHTQTNNAVLKSSLTPAEVNLEFVFEHTKQSCR